MSNPKHRAAVSKESMPPLSTGTMPVADDPSPAQNPSAAGPDLSHIRQAWSRKFRDLDSLPADTGGRTAKPQPAPTEGLPELPSLGALASKAAMSLDDLDEFLSRYHQSGPSPAPSSAKPGAGHTAVPEMPTAESDGPTTVPAPPKRGSLNAIPAFPAPTLPEVSMPLARDTAGKDAQGPASPPAPPRPDPGDLRKTAPQFSKFSPDPGETHPGKKKREAAAPHPAPAEDAREFTDEDLREALQPIISPVVDKFLYTPTQGIHTYLEPMLRSTVRRAIAEQMQDASPFKEISGWDRFAWKLRSLIGSRTYDDILFDYTRRYQVEEVFLLRPHSRSLVSYASHDPARHAKPSKVQGTVKKIACLESEHKDEDTPVIPWRDTRNLMIRRGEHCILAAIVHGPSNAILRSDLDYALRQAEERFGKTLEEENDIHLQILQPLLEGCLLIQAPAIPN